MLRKIVKISLVVLAVAFALAQLIRPDFTNPPVIQTDTLTATTNVPADVQQILTRSCNDCHSNSTQYPWYARVTPFNWFLASHIEDGRRELNFSAWNTYSSEKKEKKLEEICEQVEQASMPLPSYLWIHREAVLSESESRRLCEWARSEGARLSDSAPVE